MASFNITSRLVFDPTSTLPSLTPEPVPDPDLAKNCTPGYPCVYTDGSMVLPDGTRLDADGNIIGGESTTTRLPEGDYTTLPAQRATQTTTDEAVAPEPEQQIVESQQDAVPVATVKDAPQEQSASIRELLEAQMAETAQDVQTVAKRNPTALVAVGLAGFLVGVLLAK